MLRKLNIIVEKQKIPFKNNQSPYEVVLERDSNRLAIIKFEFEGLYPYMYTATKNPFDNCQTFCIANFASLVSLFGLGYDINNIQVTVDQKTIDERVRSFVRVLSSSDILSKRQLMVDVHAGYEAKIDLYFPNQLIKEHYTNSTGSNMIVYLLKLY